MRAIFRRTKTADGLPLTFRKMYDVLDVKTDGKQQLKEIKVKNDLGQECWYRANKFICMGIDMANGADMTVCDKPLEMTDIEKVDAAAGYVVRENLKSGKAILAGIADGFGLHYGA